VPHVVYIQHEIFTLDLALKGLKTREWFRKYTVIQKKVF